ncbi:MAG: hypothetical protein AAGA83_00115 [Cyanobacteria bacterium P01_F01_bin.116]
MIVLVFKQLLLLAVTVCLSFGLWYGPALAITYSFQSPGTPGQEGVLTGHVTYELDVVRDSLKEMSDNRGVAGVLNLEELGEGSDFSFEYVSPHSGVKHSEETICDRNIYDLNNGLEGNDVIGGKEGPFFDFNDYSDLVSIDFRSCVGDKNTFGLSSISERDPQVAYSELESQFNRLLLVESDYSGIKPGRFKKKLPIKVDLEKP